MFQTSNPVPIPKPILWLALALLLWLRCAIDAEAASLCSNSESKTGIRIFNCRHTSSAGSTFFYSVCLQRAANPPQAGERLRIELGPGLAVNDSDFQSCYDPVNRVLDLVLEPFPTMGANPCEIPIRPGPCQLVRFEVAATSSGNGGFFTVSARHYAAGVNPNQGPSKACHDDFDQEAPVIVFTPDLCIDPNACSHDFCDETKAAPTLCRDDRAGVFSDDFRSGDTRKWSEAVGKQD